MLQPALACAHGKAEVIARDIMAESRHELRVSSAARDTYDRRQRQDEALYSRALESIDLQCTAQCTDTSGSLGRGLHSVSFRNNKV